jgi:hypothetical protein
MGTLWVEKQHGRAQALGTLEAARPALALAEPASPGQSPGQPLAAAISPVYYRTKAAYVLWMLRDAAGDSSLSAALRAYAPAQPTGKTDHAAGKLAPAEHHEGLVTGHDFSRAASAAEPAGALAPEGCAPCPTRTFLEKLLESSGPRHDLSWFFADWVDTDKGLPDLTIDSVFPAPAESGNWLVAVNISNTGYTSAEVPVIVRSGSNSVTQRVLVPARGKAVQRILIQAKPTEVQVNDGTVPETQASVHVTRLDQPPQPSSSSQPGPTAF